MSIHTHGRTYVHAHITSALSLSRFRFSRRYDLYILLRAIAHASPSWRNRVHETLSLLPHSTEEMRSVSFFHCLLLDSVNIMPGVRVRVCACVCVCVCVIYREMLFEEKIFV